MPLEIFAFTAPATAGTSDMTTMPTMTSSKCCSTKGTPPKKYPSNENSDTHTMPPTTLNTVKRPKCISPMPATNGAMVRMMGKKRVRNTAMLPYLSKKRCDFARFSSDSAFTLPLRTMASPTLRPIQ